MPGRETPHEWLVATAKGEITMRKIIAITHVTLDGIMPRQAPGGSERGLHARGLEHALPG